MRVAVAVLVITQLLNLLLVPWFAHAALTLSIGLGAMINALWLLLGLLKRGSYKPEPGWGVFVLQVLAGSALLLVFLLWANGALAWTQMPDEKIRRIASLTLVLLASGVLYFATLLATGLKLRQFLRR